MEFINLDLLTSKTYERHYAKELERIEISRHANVWVLCGNDDFKKLFIMMRMLFGILINHNIANMTINTIQKESADAILNLQHPDLLYCNQELNMETVQDILEFAHTTPTVSNNKVIVISNIDCLSDKTANAILKTLEDTNSNIYFLLLGCNQHNIIPTIWSRSIPIRCIANKQSLELITMHMTSDKNVIRQALLLANGSYTLAMKLIQDDVCNLHNKVIHHLSKQGNEYDNAILEHARKINTEYIILIFQRLSYISMMYYCKSIHNDDLLESEITYLNHCFDNKYDQYSADHIYHNLESKNDMINRMTRNLTASATYNKYDNAALLLSMSEIIKFCTKTSNT